MLKQNGHLHNQLPVKFMGGGTISGNRANFGRSDRLNWVAGQHSPDKKSGFPVGYLAGGSWRLPLSAGGMSSYTNARLTVTPSGSMLMGVPIAGTATLTVEIADATGELIASGSGSASVTITTNTPLLTASLSGAGSATITVTTNTPLLGAEASAEGAANLSLSGTATIRADGYMEGSTVDNTVLTADSITSAVWNAILADFTANGTAGKALSTASSGGVDLEALAAAILAAAQVTPIHADIQKVNNVDVAGTGQSGNEWGPA